MKKKLTLDYKSEYSSQNIEIKKLRPQKSYEYLIENRNQNLNEILESKKKLKKYLKERNCPSCNNKYKKFVCEKDNLKIVKCNKCSLIYVSPTFDYEHYLKLYSNQSYQNIVRKLGEKSHEYRKKRFGSERLNILKRHYQKKRCSLLEIGCSTGFFIEQVKKNGWDALGLELNPSAVKFAQDRKLNVINKDFTKMKFKTKFDIICAFDVLEHLYDPLKVVKKVKKVLKKNGLFFLYVPNWQSATRLLIGEENSHFVWPTHHLTYFTPSTLENFLSRQGFNLVYWETQGLDMNDINWYLDHNKINNDILKKFSDKLQFMINTGGYGKNLRMIVKKI